MRNVWLAAVALLVVLTCAVIRPRLSPTPEPLPVSPRGVVLVAVEGLDVWQPFGETAFTASGLMPTRNGTSNEADFDAGLRMILAGTRTPEPNAPTLTSRSLTLETFRGATAPTDAAKRVAELTAPNGLPSGVSLLVVGVTPSASALSRRERVAPVVFWTRTGSGTPRLLTSPSTRNTPGLIAATDIAITIATLLELPEESRRIGDGRAVMTVPLTRRNVFPAYYLFQRADAWGLQAREQKRLSFLPWCLAGLVIVTTFTPNALVRRVARVVALATPVSLIVVAPVILSGFLAFTFAGWEVYTLAAVPVFALSVVAARSQRWAERLPRLLAGVTAGVIALDVCVFGGTLLGRTPLSYSVLEAARFYGIGNEVSGLFLGAALVAVGVNRGVMTTLLWGLTVAVVSGAPTLGADAGGFVATIIAFGVLAGAGQGTTPQMTRHVLVAGGAVALAIGGFAAWDGLRPPASRTHIGQAVARARENGVATLTPMVERKLTTNARLLVTSPWVILLGASLLRIAATRKSLGGTRPAIIAALVALFALNDSGVVAGATCGLWSGENPPPNRD